MEVSAEALTGLKLSLGLRTACGVLHVLTPHRVRVHSAPRAECPTS